MRQCALGLGVGQCFQISRRLDRNRRSVDHLEHAVVVGLIQR
jgi:hypothetical protein